MNNFCVCDQKITKKWQKMDQLFLLPARVLAMDSLSFREDVASVAPDFFSSHHLKNSPPHNSLDSTDSNRSSVRVLEDTEGLVFARASNGCLWLCKFSNQCCQLFLVKFEHFWWLKLLKIGWKQLVTLFLTCYTMKIDTIKQNEVSENCFLAKPKMVKN